MIARRLLLTAPALLALPRAGAAQAAWPDRPVALVVGFLPGGSVDIGSRIMADRMAPRIGPQARIIVENRPGAGGSLAAEHVARQPADGHVITMSSASSHATNPAAFPDTIRYNPVEDFSHIAILGGGPMVLAVPGTSPHRTVAELVTAAKAARAPLLWGTSGSGGIGHMTGELFAHRTGFRGEFVPYRGGSAVLEAMRKAEIDFSVEVLASALPHLRDGSSRALAVSSPTRHPTLPEVPTLQESGVAGFDIVTWNVLQGPRGIPEPVLARLNRAALEAMAEPDTRRRLTAAGIDPAEPSTPETTRAFIAGEVAKFQGIVRETGLRFTRG
ncbi:MAG: tripartite tricarboxylate transporter substrate binding protein [Acetobacteraceae bacterium]|nr:tripartite tricarboxylate transporter substrate binding protein [Acetobacteraceae bacterium]